MLEASECDSKQGIKMEYICKKCAVRSKSDLWTFDGFQTKPLWKLEILQKLLLLKVFFN